MTIFNSTIDYLLHRRDPMENEFTRSLSKLKASGDLDQLSVISGNAGGVSKYVHMEAENGLQMVSKNNYQKAATYMQLQEEGVKYANILYAEMAALALKATDPYISQSERDALSSQFAELREIALDLNHSSFADNYLFEERASTTDFAEQAKWDLDFKRIDDTILFDGTANVPQNFVGEKLYNSPYTKAPSSDVKTGTKTIIDENGNERVATYAEITRDVIYNKGDVVVDFNPGNRGERLQILQGNPDGEHRVLLDTFEWKTRGEAYNHNFDTISFSYSPDEEPIPVVGSRNYGDHVPYFLNGGHGPLSAQKDSDIRSLWNANGRNGANTDGTAKNQYGYDLWQNNAYDWVEDESARYGLGLKEAVISSTEINPVLRTPLDLYKLTGAGKAGGDQNANFNVGERNAMYELGGLQFIAKHPHAQADPPDWDKDENYRIGAGVSHNGNIYRATTDNIGNEPGTSADWEQITDPFDFEFANDYKFTVVKSADLQDEQQAKVNLGYWENGDFKSQLVFEVKNRTGLQGFDSNKAILEFEENEYYIQQSEREDKTWDDFGQNVSLLDSDNELWLQDSAITAKLDSDTNEVLSAGGAKAAQITIDGVSAWVAMTANDQKIRPEFIGSDQSIYGAVGFAYAIEVVDTNSLGAVVSHSGNGLTIELDLLQDANDKATIISKVKEINTRGLHSTEDPISTDDNHLYSTGSVFSQFHKAGHNAQAGDAEVIHVNYSGAFGNGASFVINEGAFLDVTDTSLTQDDRDARIALVENAKSPDIIYSGLGGTNPTVTLNFTYDFATYDSAGVTPDFANDLFAGLEKVLTGSPMSGTASGGKSQIYMHSKGHIAEKINEHFENNRNDSPFRNATAERNTPGQPLPFALDNGETKTAAGGVDEVLIKYEEETINEGQDEYIGKFSTSRLLTQDTGSVGSHDTGDPHFGGYTLQHVKAAFEQETSNIFENAEFSVSNPSNATDLLDKRGGSGVFLNPTGTQITEKLGQYSAYSTKLEGENEASVHIIDNNLAGDAHEGLNAWMGRDQEEATYEENVIDKTIEIKVREDNTDPRDIADAYIAYINRFTLDEAESRTDLSAFMAPVVLNNDQITPGVYQGDDVEDTIGSNSVSDYESDGSSANWDRDEEEDKFETEKSSDYIAMSNNLTVRVYQGEREMGTASGRPEDEEDSFQVRLFYTPPDEEDLETVGRESDLNVPIYALGLGLLRDDTKAEFDIGGLQMEAESRGEYTLYIKTKSADGFRDYSYNYNMYLDIDSFDRSASDISSIIEASYGNEDPNNDTSQGRFTASGDGNLEIENIFWKAGRLTVNGEVNDPSAPTNADYSFAIKSSVVNADKNHLEVGLDTSSKTLTVYVNHANSTDVSDISNAINSFNISADNTSGITFTASGSGNLGLSNSASGDFYEDGATAVFTSTIGHHGETLSLTDPESAQRAFENMAREISELGDQVDTLAQNMSKINMSDDHVSRQLAIRKDMGSEYSDEVLQSETLKIQQFEILRDYHISLLHKVMRVNEDMVRMLVLK